MTQNIGTLLSAPIIQADSADTFPTHYPNRGFGGARTNYANLAALASIPANQREQYMIVYTNDGRVYQLGTDLATWSDITLAASSDGTPGLGTDFSFLGKTVCFIGDSKTHGLGFSNQTQRGAMYRWISYFGQPGMDLEGMGGYGVGVNGYGIGGVINAGSNGDELYNFLNGPFHGYTPPSPTNTNQDYQGTYASGTAVSLQDILAWQPFDIYVIEYLTNDVMLNASSWTDTPQTITTRVLPMMISATQQLLEARPSSLIVWRTPSPAVARPALSTFQAIYPPFGSDLPDPATSLANDAVSVDNMNQGMRNAYLALRGMFPRVMVFDSWQEVTGYSSTTYTALTAGTQVPLVNDMLHESNTGYNNVADQLARALGRFVKATASIARRVMSQAYVTLNGTGNNWDQDPAYFENNPEFKQIFFAVNATLQASTGNNNIQVQIPYAEVLKYCGNYGTLYFQIGKAIAFQLNGLTPGNISDHGGGYTRFTGFTFPANVTTALGLTGAGNTVLYDMFVYGDAVNQTFQSSFLDSLSNTTWRFQVPGTISSVTPASGLVVFTLLPLPNRPSSRWFTSLANWSLAIGGTTLATYSLAGATAAENGADASRTLHIVVPGGIVLSTWVGEACLVANDSVPNPILQELELPTVQIIMAPVVGQRLGVAFRTPMTKGTASVVLSTEEDPTADLTVDLYRCSQGAANRVLITRATILGAGGAVTATVLAAAYTGTAPPVIAAGDWLEAVVIAAQASVTTLSLRVTVNPAA